MKELGARGHPGSGSGPIRFDGSTEAEVVEVKDANKTISLSGTYLEGLYITAVRQGKGARLVIIFGNGIRVDACITKEANRVTL